MCEHENILRDNREENILKKLLNCKKNSEFLNQSIGHDSGVLGVVCVTASVFRKCWLWIMESEERGEICDDF